VGNVWLIKSDPANIGTPFSFSAFLKETTVGEGVGIRIDFSFFFAILSCNAVAKIMAGRKRKVAGDEIDFGSSK